MWSDGSDSDDSVRPPRPSASSEVGIFNEQTIVAAVQEVPTVANLNVTRSSGVHIGPKFVNVTNNVQNNDVVKDLPLPAYLWSVVKNTTRAERLSCAVALLLVIICNVLIVLHFTVFAKNTTENTDLAPHEWNITRDMWLAKPMNESGREQIASKYTPVRLVIVQHTAGGKCNTFINCAAELRNLQKYYFTDPGLGYDLPYNFIIGNDGRVYEARGWDSVGAHTRGYNLCSLGIAFTGDYRPGRAEVTAGQLERAMLLLDYGVQMGYLHKDYLVLGAKDLNPSESPGSNLYNAIRRWKHYDQLNRFHGLKCDQIVATPIGTD